MTSLRTKINAEMFKGGLRPKPLSSKFWKLPLFGVAENPPPNKLYEAVGREGKFFQWLCRGGGETMLALIDLDIILSRV